MAPLHVAVTKPCGRRRGFGGGLNLFHVSLRSTVGIQPQAALGRRSPLVPCAARWCHVPDGTVITATVTDPNGVRPESQGTIKTSMGYE